ncbi:hypothetical protein DSCOOX_27330 [Desulfosarcina ovata subsp. ovata]|uniref:Uncharacterized protein n=1 Tax=Desulfosarcina ovata subsp. ovata TaxID=2752305 RepID=A0A5K8AA23_9BACT|nr:hypothetical protein DSCOOX_27330 [Desulfosarcina ovata subsp. ovata]
MNNCAQLRWIVGRLQSAGTGAYRGICSGAGNAVDGYKDKQDDILFAIFQRAENIWTADAIFT